MGHSALKSPKHLTHEMALAGMLAGDLFTIPQLCQATDKWCVDEDCFNNQGVDDSFVFMGLPYSIVDLGGYQHILINMAEFDTFMESICTTGDEDLSA